MGADIRVLCAPGGLLTPTEKLTEGEPLTGFGPFKALSLFDGAERVKGELDALLVVPAESHCRSDEVNDVRFFTTPGLYGLQHPNLLKTHYPVCLAATSTHRAPSWIWNSLS